MADTTPGTALYRQLKQQGRLIDDPGWEKCTLFAVNFHPTHMTADELREGFRKLVVRLYDDSFAQHRREQFGRQWDRHAAATSA